MPDLGPELHDGGPAADGGSLPVPPADGRGSVGRVDEILDGVLGADLAGAVAELLRGVPPRGTTQDVDGAR